MRRVYMLCMYMYVGRIHTINKTARPIGWRRPVVIWACGLHLYLCPWRATCLELTLPVTPSEVLSMHYVHVRASRPYTYTLYAKIRCSSRGSGLL